MLLTHQSPEPIELSFFSSSLAFQYAKDFANNASILSESKRQLVHFYHHHFIGVKIQPHSCVIHNRLCKIFNFVTFQISSGAPPNRVLEQSGKCFSDGNHHASSSEIPAIKLFIPSAVAATPN